MTLSETIELISTAMEGVTPGPWYEAPGTTTGRIVVAPNTTKAKRRIAALGGPDREANAAYIAACSPDRMREVLAAAREAEALKREIAELREALLPFADEAGCYDPDNGDGDDSLWVTPNYFKIRDLRRARALLSKESADAK